MKIISGGPAFRIVIDTPAGSYNPYQSRIVPAGQTDRDVFPGMMLRDYFAGQALAGMLAGEDAQHFNESPHYAAAHSYGFADAMLAERDKGGAS